MGRWPAIRLKLKSAEGNQSLGFINCTLEEFYYFFYSFEFIYLFFYTDFHLLNPYKYYYVMTQISLKKKQNLNAII